MLPASYRQVKLTPILASISYILELYQDQEALLGQNQQHLLLSEKHWQMNFLLIQIFFAMNYWINTLPAHA